MIIKLDKNWYNSFKDYVNEDIDSYIEHRIKMYINLWNQKTEKLSPKYELRNFNRKIAEFSIYPKKHNTGIKNRDKYPWADKIDMQIDEGLFNEFEGILENGDSNLNVVEFINNILRAGYLEKLDTNKPPTELKQWVEK